MNRRPTWMFRAREGLQQAIREYGGTVCIVSHDIEFIRKSATVIYAMDGQQGVKKYFGDYDYYRSKIAQEQGDGVVEEPKDNPRVGKEKYNSKEERRRKAEERKQLQRHKKQLEKTATELETEIENWEGEKEALISQLSECVPGIDYAFINRQLKTLEIRIDKANEEWNSVADNLDAIIDKYNAIE